MKDVKDMNLKEIIEWLKNVDFTRFTDKDLISLLEILEPHSELNPDIAELVEKLRNELKRRSVKRKVWVPETPTKKGHFKEVDY